MFSNRKIVLAILLLITASVAAYVILVAIPTRIAERGYEGAKTIARDIRDAFQFTPEITVNNTIVIGQQSPVLELATLSQNFEHRYEWTNKWLGSKKKITITGTFEAKAGFDLNKKFSITIQDDKARVVIPAAEILSVELLGDVAFEDEHGVWNWVNENDRSQAMNAFTLDARRYASDAPFVRDAEQAFLQKLNEILSTHVSTIDVQCGEVRIENRLR